MKFTEEQKTKIRAQMAGTLRIIRRALLEDIEQLWVVQSIGVPQGDPREKAVVKDIAIFCADVLKEDLQNLPKVRV